MSCDRFAVGMRIKAISEFSLEENLASPVGANKFQVSLGDGGEVTQVRKAGNFHWLIIKWNHINRSLNLDQSQLELVEPAT
jgi:hypothetical protein